MAYPSAEPADPAVRPSVARSPIDFVVGLGGAKRRLLVIWLERDGPRVEKPDRRGFGTELIERELKSVLGASILFDYSPHGIEVRISAPYGAQ